MTTNNTKFGREADIWVEKQRKRILVVRIVLKTFTRTDVLATNNIDNQVISHFHITYKSKYLKKDMTFENALN